MTALPERPFGGFRTLLADPAWRFANWTAAGELKNPVAHYDCMSLEQMAAMPVAQLGAADSALFMWATFPMLPEALRLMTAWGYAYRTGGAWGKQSTTGRKLAFGTGYIFRSAAELLLVGVRGKPEWLSRSERNLWLAPIREHSRKPDCVIEMIERLAPGPYVELFARQARPNWSAWGNEVGKFDVGGAGAVSHDNAPARPARVETAASRPSSTTIRRRKVQADAEPGLGLDEQAERED